MGPKAFSKVPKNLVLYKLSQNMGAPPQQQESESGGDLQQISSHLRSLSHNFRLTKKEINASLDQFLEAPVNQMGSLVGRSFNQFDMFNREATETEPSQAQKFQRPDRIHRASTNLHTLFSQTHESSLPAGVLSPSITNFQIADLLDKSLAQTGKEKADQKMRAIIQLYKRQVKDDTHLGHSNEVIIKNYRLFVVRDPVKEGMTDDVRSLFESNRGTTIHVSNSIVRPERLKFSTQVSEAITEAYPELKDLSPSKRRLPFRPPERVVQDESQSESDFDDYNQTFDFSKVMLEKAADEEH